MEHVRRIGPPARFSVENPRDRVLTALRGMYPEVEYYVSPQLPAVAERLAADPEAVAVVLSREEWRDMADVLELNQGFGDWPDAIRAQLGEEE